MLLNVRLTRGEQAMNIGVIGAGISGLTFAAAMHRFAPEVHVELYERAEDPAGTSHGYSLGLKGDAGLAVLKTLGLYDSVVAGAVTVHNFVFCNQRGQHLLELPSASDERRVTRRINRQDLKAALRAATADTPIHFGMRCVGYRQNGVIEAEFYDGDSVEVDYLVACDGAASAVRQQMLGDGKRYLGLTAVVGDAPAAFEHPLLAGGYFMTLGDDGSSIFCYCQPDGVHLSFTSHAASEADLRAFSPDSLLQRTRRAAGDWHPPIPEIAAAIDPASVVVRGYYDKQPARHVRAGRIWLIGDAAHPMSPFQGQGANLGMLDALKLARYFAGVAGSLTESETKARALETEIVWRGRKAVIESRNAAWQFHATSPIEQWFRNFGFRVSNTMIGLFAKQQARSTHE
jgi:salicylate hydroxylase